MLELQDCTDEEILDEVSARGLHLEPEDAIDMLQERGYSIYRTNEIEDIWFDIYDHWLTSSPSDFMIWLNQEFVKNIGKWI